MTHTTNIPKGKKPTKEFLKDLNGALHAFHERIDDGYNEFNVFDSFSIMFSERVFAGFMDYLLDDRQGHYQSVFLEEFLAKIHSDRIPHDIFKDALRADKFRSTYFDDRNTKYNAGVIISFENDFVIVVEVVGNDDNYSYFGQYINNLRSRWNELKNKQTILVLYLHECHTEPRWFKGRTWDVDENWYLEKSYTEPHKTPFVRNEKGEIVAHYLGIDYEWIKEWLQSSLDKLENEARKKVRGSGNTKGEMGLDRIIFGIKQYMDSIYTRKAKIDEDEVVLTGFIVRNPNNAQMALSVYRDEKHKLCDRDMRYDLCYNWEIICIRIVEEFCKVLEAKINKIGYVIHKRGSVPWFCEHSPSTLDMENNALLWFYPRGRDINDEDWVFPIFTLKCCHPKFSNPCLSFTLGYKYNWTYQREDGKRIIKNCAKFFHTDAGRYGLSRLGSEYYHFGSFYEENSEALSEDYALAHWIIAHGENAADKFLEILQDFANLPPVKKALKNVESYIVESKKEEKEPMLGERRRRRRT